ncbi:MAG: extracellular solute-binding protein, partial [Treponema sp.]|nr:extracellular solute-binding protein [Treponema sp.]
MKLFGIMVIFLVLQTAFVFSGGGKESSGDAAGNTGAQASPNFNPSGYPIVKEKINITCIKEGTMQRNPRILWEEIEKLTNIHVDILNIESQQFATFMAAGEWPDFFHDRLKASFINDHGIIGNRFADYNEYLQYMPNLAKLFSEDPKDKKISTESNGKIYQLPRWSYSVTDTMARFYFRSDNLKKYNVAVPKTIDEFYYALVTLKRATGAAHWVEKINDIELWFYPSFGTSLEPDFDSGSGNKVIFNRTSDQYKRFLQFLNKCYAEGLLHKEFLTLDNATRLQMCKSGAATFWDGTIQSTVLADFPS